MKGKYSNGKNMEEAHCGQMDSSMKLYVLQMQAEAAISDLLEGSCDADHMQRQQCVSCTRPFHVQFLPHHQ